MIWEDFCCRNGPVWPIFRVKLVPMKLVRGQKRPMIHASRCSVAAAAEASCLNWLRPSSPTKTQIANKEKHQTWFNMSHLVQTKRWSCSESLRRCSLSWISLGKSQTDQASQGCCTATNMAAGGDKESQASTPHHPSQDKMSQIPINSNTKRFPGPQRS